MKPILPGQTLVRPGQLAAALGVSRSTLHRWTINDVRVRGCLFRDGYYSVQKLRDCGMLTRDGAAAKTEQQSEVSDAG